MKHELSIAIVICGLIFCFQNCSSFKSDIGASLADSSVVDPSVVPSQRISGACDAGNSIPPFRPYACLKNYYVDSTGGNDTNSGAQEQPWATLQKADSGRVAGDCIYVAPGVYDQVGNEYYGLTLSSGGNLNTPTGYVAWISTVPHAAVITGRAPQNSLVGVYNASYIIFDGFELNAKGLPGNAFVADTATGSHHIMVLHSVIHDAGAAGISFNHGDYYTIYGNDVYNNQFTNPVRSSGISIWHPAAMNFTHAASDDSSATHIVVSYNTSHDNVVKYSCTSAQIAAGSDGCPHSDGEGIIFDNWSDSQDPNPVGYPFSGLIDSNLVFGNGSGGIQVFTGGAIQGQQIVVKNNRAFNNFLDTLSNLNSDGSALPGRGEINLVGDNNVLVTGNIMYAVPVAGHPVLKYNKAITESPYPNPTSTGILWTDNITYPAIGVDAFQYSNNAPLFANFTANNHNGDISATCGQPGPFPAGVVNGACEASKGTCAVGFAIGLMGSGPWYWECAGSNGGSDAKCLAN